VVVAAPIAQTATRLCRLLQSAIRPAFVHVPAGEVPEYLAETLTARWMLNYSAAVDYSKIITIEPGKRSGKPCIRGMRITVQDVFEYLAGGMTEDQILEDFPELTREDINACFAFAADRERKLFVAPA
jgi:uncharacterized protein (DUF433 family)